MKTLILITALSCSLAYALDNHKSEEEITFQNEQKYLLEFTEDDLDEFSYVDDPLYFAGVEGDFSLGQHSGNSGAGSSSGNSGAGDSSGNSGAGSSEIGSAVSRSIGIGPENIHDSHEINIRSCHERCSKKPPESTGFHDIDRMALRMWKMNHSCKNCPALKRSGSYKEPSELPGGPSGPFLGGLEVKMLRVLIGSFLLFQTGCAKEVCSKDNTCSKNPPASTGFYDIDRVVLKMWKEKYKCCPDEE